MRYVTRNHAFTPVTTWVLDGAVLRLEDDKGPPRVIALAGVWALRLEFAPTRPERDRFRCRVELATGETLEFFNRTCGGVCDFVPSDADYVAFVQALVAALRRHAPSCHYLAGKTEGVYLANLLATGVLGAGLIVAAGWLYLNGLVWLIVVKVLILAAYAPALMRWVARNRPHAFSPESIPDGLLPRPAARRG